MKSIKDLSQIEPSIRRMVEAQQAYKKASAFYDAVKKKEQLVVTNWMYSNLGEQKSFEIILSEGEEFYLNPVRYLVTNARKRTVLWNVEFLKQKLSKDILRQVVKKEYKINDMEGLVSYLKSKGVDPKKFRTFIDVIEEVDNKVLDNLYDLGKIKEKQIEGCYIVKLGEPYLKITEKK